MEAVEGAAAISPIPERQAKAAGSEPPLPGAPEGTTSARNCCRNRREGHSYKIFFRAPATVPDAMGNLSTPGGRPYNAFVPMPAATLWSEFCSGRGAGGNGDSSRSEGETFEELGAPCGNESLPIWSGHIALGAAVSLSSACGQGEEGGARPAAVGAASFSLLLRLEGEPEDEAWNWNFINSIFAASD
jgi:hypothetical protein